MRENSDSKIEQEKNGAEAERDSRSQVEGDNLSSLNMPADTRERVITIAVLVGVLITIWFMLEVVIITFILTFVFYHLQKYVLLGLNRQPIKAFRRIPDGIVLLIIYISVISLLVLLVVKNVPLLLTQLIGVASAISNFDTGDVVKGLDPSLLWLIEQINFNSILSSIGSAIMNGLASLGPTILNFLISALISFLLIVEKNRLFAIGRTMENSRIAFIYRYFKLFGKSFCNTFGKVMKVQIVIAAINCGISVTYLSIAGFPYIAVLGLMIFILGLIPVMGVFISMVPLLIIAFNVGGIFKIIEVIVVIVIIHCVEAYFLNPKLMSRRTSLPISIVFIVLIISQRYLGAWGMLIGVPIFIYIMNVLSIDYRKAMETESIREAAIAAEKSSVKHSTTKYPKENSRIFKRRK